ncbi:MAG TPA: iron chelate uptake ABC transporter family permease subunit [Phycisphaerales bacterium]|nr:iron chelate uptake ABC transporter family permease subunit [Phycisphaerales bacterium]
MDELLRLLTLQDSNTRVVLLGTSVLGVASAVIGTFAVLRRRSLVGDAVAHAALPGVCAAYFAVGDRNFAAFMLGALVFGVAAAAFVSFVRSATRIKEDAAIALAIGGFFGVGIVLSRMIQNQPGGNRAGIDSFIYGKAASMVGDDARLILVVAAAVLGTAALFYKEFKALCFDRDFAASQGWPTLTLDLLLMGLICTCTVVGLPAVGVVLMVSLLVIPPVAARFWTNRLSTMLLIAAVLGGVSGVLGTALSATLPVPEDVPSRGWPTGPLITLVATAIFVVSLLLAPRRGLVGDLVRRVSLRRRVAEQNLLRAVYEHLEDLGELGTEWSASQLDVSAEALPRMVRRGLVARAGAGAFRLTDGGQAEAAKVVRAHRLWELFLIQQADIAPDHVDRDADQIEHVLSPEVLAHLEERLHAMGRLPGGVPRSPHPIHAGGTA